MFPEEDIAGPQMSNEDTDGLAPSVFAIFPAQLERILALFRQRAKEDPRRETTGSESRHAPEAWYYRTGTLQAQIQTPCDPSLEHPTDKVVPFWQRTSYFSP